MKSIVLAGLLVLASGLGAAAPAQDAAAEEKRRDIRRLLQVMGAGDIGVQVLNQMFPEMRAVLEHLFAELSEAKRQRAIDIMKEEVVKTFTAERMVEETIPLYERLLTGEEVKALIAFFESPVGRKYISVMPQLLRESNPIAEKLTAESYARIEARLRAEGIEPPAGTPPPKPAKTRPPARRKPR